MNPTDTDELMLISESEHGSILTDKTGDMYYKGPDGEVKSFDQLVIDGERTTEKTLLNNFPGQLENENDVIYIRRTGGRLKWIVGNHMTGSPAKWNELTPHIAKAIDSGKIIPESPEAIKAVEAMKIQEPEAYEIGWYQDIKGDLYQFDGKTWVGTIPSKKQIENLEYLG